MTTGHETLEYEGQCCEACGGDGENYCEYAHAMRTCPECMGTGVVDYESRLEDRKKDVANGQD